MTALTTVQCEEKWAAMLEGLEGQQSSVTAWLLEREVRHLQAEVDADDNKASVLVIGARAKAILPALRLAARRLLPASAVSAVEQLGRLATWPQSLTVEEVYKALDEAFVQMALTNKTLWAWQLGEIGVGPQVRELAERTYESLLAYPGSSA